MQEQGKRLLIAVVLALGVMLAWQWLFPPKKPPPTPPKTQGSGQVVQGPAPKVGPTPAAPATPATKATPAKPRGAEQTLALTSPRFTATFSSYGGILKSWHLSDKRYDRDVTKGELLPVGADTGAFAISFTNGSTYHIPADADWVGKKLSDTSVAYTLTTDHLEIVKTYTIIPASFLVRMNVKVTVTGSGPPARQALAVSAFGYQNPKDKGGGGRSVAPRVWESSTMRGGTLLSTTIDDLTKAPRFESNITWTGFEHPYLLVAFAPKPGAGAVDKETFAQSTPGLMRTDLLYPSVELKPGAGALDREVVAYLGPKDYKTLDAADAAAGFPTGFHTVIDFGWFGFIGRPLLWLLQAFYAFLGNWGLAIVLLTFLVKAVTVPLLTKSMRSMKAMAVLGPQMKELQAKYKDDKQRLQIETMALYKEYGVNPLSGCLPIVLQMPVWFALYRMLSSAGELYQQPFIPGWISDLTSADPYYVLPVILVVTMFAQARLTPQNADPSQKLQQRLMQYGMPLMFGVMAFWFPAGLTLYIFTNTVLSAFHSIYMNRFDKKSLEFAEMLKQKQAAKEAAEAKGAKDANAKDANAKAGQAGDTQAKSKPRPNVAGQRRNKKGRRR